MRFARWTFLIAGVYGILVILPLFFAEQQMNTLFPPAINHPEYYYGFAAVALAWQFLFLLIAREPLRLRPAMLPAILEKIPYGLAVMVLYMQGRVSSSLLLTAAIDLLLGILFIVAFWRTRRQ
ncbi:MAG: hypothetical protein IPK16_03740 [Anaerolineales bacterium]|nr:hypothetical protein [Anaerolineales bacterium]